MSCIQLTPYNTLRWELEEQALQVKLSSYRESFERDWREGLFSLGAKKEEDCNLRSFRYWRDFSKSFIAKLCLFYDLDAVLEQEAPSTSEVAEFLLVAPPMDGGEYLSPSALKHIWQSLLDWTIETIQKSHGLSTFLQEYASAWHQVGRVCFHLAENRGNEDYPFAFMATYTASLNSSGKARHLPLRKALEEYAGAHNRDGLRKLLTPIHQASERCSWVAELVESRQIYQALAWTPEEAHFFLNSVLKLEESGLTVRLPNWWEKRSTPRVSVRIETAKKTKVGAAGILEFEVEVALGDEKLTSKELEELLASKSGLVTLKGQWVELDQEKLKEALEQWKQIEAEHSGGLSFIEGMRLLAGTSMNLKEEDSERDSQDWLEFVAGQSMQDLLSKLRKPGQMSPPDPGESLLATLRPYQEDGLAWLYLLTSLGLGACLADDMGLGKTLQTLALLLCMKADTKKKKKELMPSLLVLPASLLGNWESEAKRFAPNLKLIFLHSAMIERKNFEEIANDPKKYLLGIDLVVTTYGMLLRQEWLGRYDWQLVILDEAQAIKNPRTKQTKAVKSLRSRARIALTGTPVENRLGDLWSLFDFLNPGLLGSTGVFKKFIQSLEKRDSQQFAPLRKLVSPYILRRMKTDRTIIADLPEKTEVTRYSRLTKRQIKYYQQITSELEEMLEEGESTGIQRKGLVLQALMRLKQLCNHPSQLVGDFDYNPRHSGKFQLLSEICEGIAERQEKVLVFSQFREIIEPLETHLTKIFGRGGLQLHGGTPVKKRKFAVEQFQDPDGPSFFIISLKAGGTGLNLTAASHVIHFDRWWNPAVENQATDRAFRIGQKKNVLVHKFVSTGTIEERIDQLIQEKQELADEILSGNSEAKLTELSDDALLELVSLDVTRASF